MQRWTITYKSDEVRWYQNGKQLKKSPLKQAVRW